MRKFKTQVCEVNGLLAQIVPPNTTRRDWQILVGPLADPEGQTSSLYVRSGTQAGARKAAEEFTRLVLKWWKK